MESTRVHKCYYHVLLIYEPQMVVLGHVKPIVLWVIFYVEDAELRIISSHGPDIKEEQVSWLSLKYANKVLIKRIHVIIVFKC